jgi:hypothetical protein
VVGVNRKGAVCPSDIEAVGPVYGEQPVPHERRIAGAYDRIVLELIRMSGFKDFELAELLEGIEAFWSDKARRNRYFHDEWFPVRDEGGIPATRGLPLKKGSEVVFDDPTAEEVWALAKSSGITIIFSHMPLGSCGAVWRVIASLRRASGIGPYHPQSARFRVRSQSPPSVAYRLRRLATPKVLALGVLPRLQAGVRGTSWPSKKYAMRIVNTPAQMSGTTASWPRPTCTE